MTTTKLTFIDLTEVLKTFQETKEYSKLYKFLKEKKEEGYDVDAFILEMKKQMESLDPKENLELLKACIVLEAYWAIISPPSGAGFGSAPAKPAEPAKPVEFVGFKPGFGGFGKTSIPRDLVPKNLFDTKTNDAGDEVDNDGYILLRSSKRIKRTQPNTLEIEGLPSPV